MVSPTDEVQPERGTSSCLRGMQTRIACMQASKHINTKNLEVSKPNGWSASFFCEFKIHLLRIIFLYVCVVCVYYAECMYLAVRACLCPCTWDVMTAFNVGHTKKQNHLPNNLGSPTDKPHHHCTTIPRCQKQQIFPPISFFSPCNCETL